VVSVCAGQGRDLLGVLATHPRRHDEAFGVEVHRHTGQPRPLRHGVRMFTFAAGESE
jgi:hypothetical protein